MVEEIIDLGFNKIELNYKVTHDMAKEILLLVERGIVNITSIHNVFPKSDNPDFSPDSVFLAHPDPVKREEAINVTKKTVDMAYIFGAKAVVLHTSEIPMQVEYDDILKELYKQGKRNTAEYNRVKDEFISYRNSVSHKYLELTCESLEKICNYIEKKGYPIILGIENRSKCHQIPNFYEAQILIERLKHFPVYFWYDIGHAIIQDALGLLDNPNGVYKIIDRLFGVHIHDVVNFRDHCCPYASGEDKYDEYIEIIRKTPTKVFEIGSFETKESIIKSADLLYRKLKNL